MNICNYIKFDKQLLLVVVMILVYTIVFSYLTALRHFSYATGAYDLGLFDYSFWHTINRGSLFYNPIEEGSHFKVHFSPIMFLILPIYFLYQSPLTLLFLQALILALGALPVYLIAKEKIDKKAGVFFACLYLLYPVLHGVNRFDFHPAVFSCTFLLFTFYYLQKKDYKKYFLFLILSLSCVEYIALVGIFLGLYGLLFNPFKLRKIKLNSSIFIDYIKKRLIFLLTLIISVIWLVLAIKIICIFNNGKYIHFARYKNYGSTSNDFISFITTIINHLPELLLECIKTEKIDYIIVLLLPFCFLSILSPKELFIAFPIIFMNISTPYEPMYSIYYQYSAPIIPFVCVSAIYGFSKLINKENRKRIEFLILTVMILSVIQYSPIPIVINGVHIGKFSMDCFPNKHDEILNKVINLLPPNASIIAQNNIFPHISHRDKVTIWLKNYSEYEYIILDTKQPYQLKITIKDENKIFELLKTYGIYIAIDGILVLKKNYSGPVLYPYKHGLIAHYYDIVNNISYQEVVPEVNLDWGEGKPFLLKSPDNFKVIFRGYIYIPTSGNYTFKLFSDDGSTLIIDNVTVIDGYNKEVFEGIKTIYLSKGCHKIIIKYRELKGLAFIKLYWLKNHNWKIVPSEHFYWDKKYCLNNN